MFFSVFCLCFIFQFRLLGWYSESFDPCPQAAEIKFLSQTFLFTLLFFLVYVLNYFSNKKFFYFCDYNKNFLKIFCNEMSEIAN